MKSLHVLAVCGFGFGSICGLAVPCLGAALTEAAPADEVAEWRKTAAALIAKCRLETSAEGVMYFAGEDVERAWSVVALQSPRSTPVPATGNSGRSAR